jgi:ubiquinone/menaquinone biosynthesis C-methylase UbiE
MSHFDSKARQWDENPVFQERGRKMAAAIAAAVPLASDWRALDYGSGTGLLSFPLQPSLAHITLADSSAGMLEVLHEKIAAQKVGNMTALKLDLLTDPLPAQRFDLIYSAMALHHIPDTDAILRIFGALLNPGGWLCLIDLDQEDGSFHGIEFEVHHGFDRAQLARQAHAAGLGEAVFSTVFSIRKEKAAGPRDYPVFLMAAQKR